MTKNYSQGMPFDGDYRWRNDEGTEAVRDGEFEGYLEQRYELSGTVRTYVDGEYWQRYVPRETLQG